MVSQVHPARRAHRGWRDDEGSCYPRGQGGGWIGCGSCGDAAYAGGYIRGGILKRKHFIFFDFLCKSRDQQVKLDGRELQEYAWEYPGAAFRLELDSFTRKTLEKYLQRS